MLPVTKDGKLFVTENRMTENGSVVVQNTWVVSFEDEGHIKSLSIGVMTFLPIQLRDNHRHFLCQKSKQCVSIHSSNGKYFGHIWSYPNGKSPIVTFTINE